MNLKYEYSVENDSAEKKPDRRVASKRRKRSKKAARAAAQVTFVARPVIAEFPHCKSEIFG